jgi:ABC-2 type transport system permease protein
MNQLSLWQAAKLVATREITVKLRDKTFIFGTLLYLAFVIGSFVIPGVIEGGPTKVAVVSSATRSADALRSAGDTVQVVADRAAAEKLVRDKDVEAAVVQDGDTVKVLALDDSPGDVVRALSDQPSVELLNPDALDPILSTLAPIAFSLVFFMTSITFGVQIAQSVAEEKQTRIVEILVATVPVRALLAGKVMASSLLAFGQIALIGVLALIGTQIAHAGSLFTVLGPAIGWFIPFFVVGFVMLAALWAVAGALVSRVEDVAGSAMPVQLLVMLPFFAVAFFNQNETVLTVLSYIPFSAPTAMPIRMLLGEARPWEPFLALAVLVVTTAGFVLLGARVYEGSLLRTSGRTRLAVAWQQRAQRLD